MKKDIKSIETTPFGGGADIRHRNEPALIKTGGYSNIQNMRNMYGGLKKRPGCAKLHSTADSNASLVDTAASVFTSGTYGWVVDGNNTLANVSNTLAITYVNHPSGAFNYLRDASDLTANLVVGHTYRVSMQAKYTGGAAGSRITMSAGALATMTPLPANLTTSMVTYTWTFVATAATTDLVNIYGLSAGNVVTIDNWYVYEVIEVMSMYQFVKGKKTERHFFAQMSDSDVLEATAAPPAVTAGVFGSEVFSGSASPLPASWANLNDFLLFCNGVDLPQIYPGTGNFVDAFYVYKGSFDPMTYANIFSGTDYSTEVSDGDSATAADVSSLGLLAETLGDEKITNGAFAGDTDWTKGGTAAITTYLDLPAQNDEAHQILAGIVIGEQYKLTVVLATASGAVGFLVYNNYSDSYVQYTAVGSKSQYWTATTATPEIRIKNQDAGHNTADTISFKKCAYHCLFVRTPIPVQSLGFTVPSVNGAAAVAAIKYWDGDSFADVAGFADGTSVSAKAFAQSGSMTWTAPTDEVASCLYSQVGYWYMIYLSSGALDSDTKISACSYESAWQAIKNIWDGVPVDVIEAQKYTSSTGAYSTYAAEAITLNSFASTDALYFSTYDDIEGIFVDVLTPNATGDTLSLFRWDGTAWQAVTIADQTAGFSRNGRIIFTRGTSKRQDFNLTGYMAHWYKLTTGSNLAATVLIGLSVQPYFDITEIGKGQTVCAWKNQAIYGTNQDHYIYLSAPNQPQALNGDNSTMLKPGDGRYNRPVAMRNFADDLMVWQEEKGQEGGCLTKFSWVTDLTDIKTTIISTSLGAMNSKSVDVVDGVEAAELNRDIPVMTLAFCLSRKGVYITDGSACYMISGEISNYFDPTDVTCIRAGYEKEHWLQYDSAYGVIRLGLVSGSSATVPNVFPVYDVKLKAWVPDSLAQELSCMTEAEAGSGSIPVLQIGGGVDDGFIYLLNTGTNDVSTAIDSFATLEFDMQGYKMCMSELLLRVKAQTAGNIIVTPYINGQAQTAMTLAQIAATAGDKHRRHRKKVNIVGDHISLKIQHNTASEDCYLLDYGAAVEIYNEQ